MTLQDCIDEVRCIMTEWPEADRLAGVLRVVRAMQEELVDVDREGAMLLLTNEVKRLHARLALAERCIDVTRQFVGGHSVFFREVNDAIVAYDAAKGRVVVDSVADMPCGDAGRASDSAEGTTSADPRVCDVSSQTIPVPEPPAITWPGEIGVGPRPPRSSLKFGREEAELLKSLHDEVPDDPDEELMWPQPEAKP